MAKNQLVFPPMITIARVQGHGNGRLEVSRRRVEWVKSCTLILAGMAAVILGFPLNLSTHTLSLSLSPQFAYFFLSAPAAFSVYNFIESNRSKKWLGEKGRETWTRRPPSLRSLMPSIPRCCILSLFFRFSKIPLKQKNFFLGCWLVDQRFGWVCFCFLFFFSFLVNRGIGEFALIRLR